MLRADRRLCEAQGAEAGKKVEFSLTTNATLLTERSSTFWPNIASASPSVMDGDRELNDRMRVFHDGTRKL